jgi:hypothetical protein
MGITNFRPQLHGFDFDNHWDLDDNHRAFIRKQISDAVPLAIEVIVTNPAIGAALLGALGAAYGVGEALLPGLFDTIAIPIIVSQLVNTVNNEIENGLPDNYGLCGGMAFAPLDYYYQQWVIPKGIHPNGKDSNDQPFIVPPGSDPNAAILRNYINKRFDDTWDSGGVRDKMVEWYVILKTIPSQFGGGGPEVQKRSQGEWTALAGLLDQGKPQPIALLFDDWNIFNNHQVVAYGYGGDPFSGAAFINIYDNNNPNQELFIRLDFTQSEMQGRITDTAGNEVTTFDNKTKKAVPMYAPLKGFFRANYSPETPPQSWGVQNGINAQPCLCQSAKETFSLTASIANAFTFFKAPSQSTTITPVTVDPWKIHVIPPTYPALPAEDASKTGPIGLVATDQFNNAGDFILMANAFVKVVDGAGAVAMDQFGSPLSCFRNLPALIAGASASVQLHVLDRLQMVAVKRSGASCYFPYVEGGSVILRLKQNPFSGSNIDYFWQVSGATLVNLGGDKVEVSGLPAAGSNFTVTLKVINRDSGCIATGSATFTTYSADQAARFTGFCQLAHIISHYMQPGLINPLGPDSPEFTKFLQDNLQQLRKDATHILKITERLGGVERTN